jgi:hypothetical protein
MPHATRRRALLAIFAGMSALFAGSARAAENERCLRLVSETRSPAFSASFNLAEIASGEVRLRSGKS